MNLRSKKKLAETYGENLIVRYTVDNAKNLSNGENILVYLQYDGEKYFVFPSISEGIFSLDNPSSKIINRSENMNLPSNPSSRNLFSNEISIDELKDKSNNIMDNSNEFKIYDEKVKGEKRASSKEI